MNVQVLEKCKHGINLMSDWCESCHLGVYPPGFDGSFTGGSSSYYELPRDCQTLQDIIVQQGMYFTQGNIFKAAYRWEKKPDLMYNLEKIIWFAQDALDRLYKENPDNPRGNCYESSRRKSL